MPVSNQTIGGTGVAGGTWTIENTNTAMIGRYHDLATLLEGAAGTNEYTTARAGCLPGAADSGSNVPSCFAAAPTSGLSMSIRRGAAVVERNTLVGSYIVVVQASGTVTLTTADATNPRIDRVDLQVLDGVLGDNGGTSLTQYIVTTGTAAGSPAVPAAPANSIPICQVLLPANTLTITSGMITDTRKSASVRGAVRVMLPGDSLSDPGFAPGELRNTTAISGAVPRIDQWNHASATWVRIIDLLGPQVGEVLLLAAVTSTAATWSVPAAWTGPNQGLVFNAPASGIVRLDYSTRMHSANGGSFQQMTPIVLTGSTIGSGSSVLPASSDYSLQVLSSAVSDFTSASWVVLTGLTPGASYNVQMAVQGSSGIVGTMTFTSTRILATPIPA